MNIKQIAGGGVCGATLGTVVAMPVVAYAAIAGVTFRAVKPDSLMKPMTQLAGGSMLLFGGGLALLTATAVIGMQVYGGMQPYGISVSKTFEPVNEILPDSIIVSSIGGMVIAGITAIGLASFSAITATTLKSAYPATRYTPFIKLTAYGALGALVISTVSAVLGRMGLRWLASSDTGKRSGQVVNMSDDEDGWDSREKGVSSLLSASAASRVGIPGSWDE